MLSKELAIEIDESSWGGKSVPSWLSGAAPRHDLDVQQALLMLGTLTLPSLISPASPARTWAAMELSLPADALRAKDYLQGAEIRRA
jgi:hypothetical protein